MKKNPIVLTEGQLEQLQAGDYLPNQQDIDELREIIILLVNEISEMGLPIQSEKLVKLLKS